MNIAVIGAPVVVGSAVLNERLQRGHRVMALARNPAKIAGRDGLTVADAEDTAQVPHVAQGHDAMTYGERRQPGLGQSADPRRIFERHPCHLCRTRASGVRRLRVVDGASSLFLAPGVQLVDTPAFPPNRKPGHSQRGRP